MRKQFPVLLGLAIALGAPVAAAAAEPAGGDARAERKVNYVPQIEGAVKAKFELSTYDGKFRFNVRNSRFGVKGLVSPHMSYKMQVDFSNEGKLSVLDAYVAYAQGHFEFVLGQQQYRFSADLDRGPSTNYFANRSFLAKYLTSYYSIDGDGRATVKTIGSRDIGARLTYKSRTEVPFRVLVGAFNGSGINNPEWQDGVNVMTRLEVGGEKEGLCGAISYYNGQSPSVQRPSGADGVESYHQKMQLIGGGLRYLDDHVYAEAEYAQRRLKGAARTTEVMHAAYVQGFYKFVMPPSWAVVRYLAPIGRWDMGSNVDYLNTADNGHEWFSANRMTLGLNIGFVETLLRSELRVNYEKYFLKRKPGDFARNPLLQDKFTIEIVASF
ncbi:MAG: hypothetical protein IJC16_03170 [Rikenellaceae bacterium]|nr:hypothetical protein [Rikenellaceae bacterium]